MNQDFENFTKWYVEPLEMLEKIPSGDGGFIALATACFLYERYAIAFLGTQGKKAEKSEIHHLIVTDFQIEFEAAEAFWDVVRDGLLHEGMPMQKKNNKELPRWATHHEYPAIALENIGGQMWLKVQPWKITKKVIELWGENFQLLSRNNSFPWACTGEVPA